MATPSDGGGQTFSNQNTNTQNSTYSLGISSCHRPSWSLLFHLSSNQYLFSAISILEEPPGKACPPHGASAAKGIKWRSPALRKRTSQSDQHQLPSSSCSASRPPFPSSSPQSSSAFYKASFYGTGTCTCTRREEENAFLWGREKRFSGIFK